MIKKAVIIANGQFPTHPHPLNCIKNAEFLICCDGAIQELDKRNIVPDKIIGDLDSISQLLFDKYKNIITKVGDQETNDLTKAVNWSLKNKFTHIDIIGASGKREDHFIGNFALLTVFCKNQHTTMITDYGIFTTARGNTIISCRKGQAVSIFALNPATKVSTNNLKYPLKNETIPSLWYATLNETISTNFSLQISNKEDLIIYMPH